jgi:feruloyl esterase
MNNNNTHTLSALTLSLITIAACSPQPPSATDATALATSISGQTDAAVASQCSALQALAIPNVLIDGAEQVSAGTFQLPAGVMTPPGAAQAAFGNLPDFCRVTATLTPSADSDIKVEIWLPLDNWNGRLAAIGNGVWAGSISYVQMASPLSRGYVTVATDTGHQGSGMDALWAVGHPEKMLDFGHRAVHEMTVTAKTVSQAFYGQPPQFSLWASCSTGGRQGLMAAYRYPTDFDAISSMAPANPMTGLMTQSLWTGYQALRAPEFGLTPATLASVHRAYLQSCDALDGLEDGIVSHPQQCAFDPAVLQCTADTSDECLTPPQIDTLQAIYQGVINPRTGEVMFDGFPAGSESQLSALVMGPVPFMAATSYMRDIVFEDPDWDFKSFDYDAHTQLARDAWGHVLDVPADGLDAFFARGGKLLLSHGWQDGLIPAGNTIRFYNELLEHLDDNTAREQLRLFMIPGMAHCAGGDAPHVFDALGLVDSLAQGAPMPELIIATSAPGTAAKTRPLCPYPQLAVYLGEGDPNEAASFECRMP